MKRFTVPRLLSRSPSLGLESCRHRHAHRLSQLDACASLTTYSLYSIKPAQFRERELHGLLTVERIENLRR